MRRAHSAAAAGEDSAASTMYGRKVMSSPCTSSLSQHRFPGRHKKVRRRDRWECPCLFVGRVPLTVWLPPDSQNCFCKAHVSNMPMLHAQRWESILHIVSRLPLGFRWWDRGAARHRSSFRLRNNRGVSIWDGKHAPHVSEGVRRTKGWPLLDGAKHLVHREALHCLRHSPGNGWRREQGCPGTARARRLRTRTRGTADAVALRYGDERKAGGKGE